MFQMSEVNRQVEEDSAESDGGCLDYSKDLCSRRNESFTSIQVSLLACPGCFKFLHFPASSQSSFLSVQICH